MKESEKFYKTMNGIIDTLGIIAISFSILLIWIAIYEIII